MIGLPPFDYGGALQLPPFFEVLHFEADSHSYSPAGAFLTSVVVPKCRAMPAKSRVSVPDQQSHLGHNVQLRLSVRLFLVATTSLLLLSCAAVWAQDKSKQGRKAQRVAGRVLTLPTSRVNDLQPNPSHPTRVYSATPKGLFVSDDSGRSWQSLPVDRTNDEVFSLAFDPKDPGGFFVGRRDGLWHTRDGGKSWNRLTYPGHTSDIPLAVAIAESQPNVIYVATGRQGIYKSDSGGYGWTEANQGLPEARAGGRPEEIRTLVVDPQNPNVAYVAHDRHGVYQTTDGGMSWHPFKQGLPPAFDRPTYSPQLAFDPNDPSLLYLVFGQPIHSHLVRNRLYVSSSTGEWLPAEVELPPNKPIEGLSVDKETRNLRFRIEETIWELPFPGQPGTKP